MNKATKSLTLYLSASVVRYPTSDASLLAPAYHPKVPNFSACVYKNVGAHLCGYTCMYM